MSFFYTPIQLLFQEVCLQMNDILLIAIVCFFMGRLYERGWTSNNSIDLNVYNREAGPNEGVIEEMGQSQEERMSEKG